VKQQLQQVETQIAAMQRMGAEAAGAAKMLEHLIGLAMAAEMKRPDKEAEQCEQVNRMAGLVASPNGQEQ
jgi:hypothetical protein